MILTPQNSCTMHKTICHAHTRSPFSPLFDANNELHHRYVCAWYITTLVGNHRTQSAMQGLPPHGIILDTYGYNNQLWKVGGHYLGSKLHLGGAYLAL